MYRDRGSGNDGTTGSSERKWDGHRDRMRERERQREHDNKKE